jgi:hypothetical protein
VCGTLRGFCGTLAGMTCRCVARRGSGGYSGGEASAGDGAGISSRSSRRRSRTPRAGTVLIRIRGPRQRGSTAWCLARTYASGHEIAGADDPFHRLRARHRDGQKSRRCAAADGGGRERLPRAASFSGSPACRTSLVDRLLLAAIGAASRRMRSSSNVFLRPEGACYGG